MTIERIMYFGLLFGTLFNITLLSLENSQASSGKIGLEEEFIEVNNDKNIKNINGGEQNISVIEKINIVLSDIDAEHVLVTESTPDYVSGADVPNYEKAFSTKELDVKDGQVELSLGDSPVIIELDTTYAAANLIDSPFGFHPIAYEEIEYAQDLGADWNRPVAMPWDFQDADRDGSFKFRDLQLVDDLTGQTMQVDLETPLSLIPDDIHIVMNICPFRFSGKLDPDEYDTYGEFVTAVVERYDGDSNFGCSQSPPDCYKPGDKHYPKKRVIDRMKKSPVKYWQVCNKLNQTWAPGSDKNPSEAYTEVLKSTYNAVKEADPTSYVMTAGDSRSSEYPAVFKLLNGDFLDIVDFHYYPAADEYIPNEFFDYLAKSLKESGFDLSKIKFWVTETGTWSGTPKNIPGTGLSWSYQTERQQAGGLLRIHVSALAYGIEKILWAPGIFEGFKRNCDSFDLTGLIFEGCDCSEGRYQCNEDDSPIGEDKGKLAKKLSYYTYKLMVEKLEGSDWDNIETIMDGTDNIYVYKFYRTDLSRPIYVAWRDEKKVRSTKEPQDQDNLGEVPIQQSQLQKNQINQGLISFRQTPSELASSVDCVRNCERTGRPLEECITECLCGNGTCEDMERQLRICPEDCGKTNQISQPSSPRDCVRNCERTGRPLEECITDCLCGNGICEDMERRLRVCSEDCGKTNQITQPSSPRDCVRN